MEQSTFTNVNNPNNENDMPSLIQRLKDIGLIKKGNFILKSGLPSNLYFDFKGLISQPELIYEISIMLSELITCDNVCISGVPIGGIPYAVLVSQITKLPMVIIRDEKKTYGLCHQIEGNTFGRDMILIEDVITTGASVMNTLEILKENGINVKEILCILDRGVGGVQKIVDKGYTVKVIYHMNDIV